MIGFYRPSRPSRLLRMAWAAGLASLLCGCADLRRSVSLPPTNPESPVAATVSAAARRSYPIPRLTDVPPTPRNVPVAAQVKLGVVSMVRCRGGLDRYPATHPPLSGAPEQFAAAARDAAEVNASDVPPPNSAARADAAAADLRAFAAPPGGDRRWRAPQRFGSAARRSPRSPCAGRPPAPWGPPGSRAAAGGRRCAAVAGLRRSRSSACARRFYGDRGRRRAAAAAGASSRPAAGALYVSASGQPPCRIGVAGLGTVGTGLLELLRGVPDYLPDGRRVQVTGVCARSRSRAIDISQIAWFDDPVALARAADVDVFVELIGGAEGPAKASVEAALQAGKPVVTANKALIAEHGLALARLAEDCGVALLFEAAVMGGVPAVKLLREGLVADEVDSVAGILNGTCNYILSEMEASGRDFADVLAEAQRLGYAEADPVTDVGGFDAAHKIAILAALAFGGAPNFAAAHVEGIEAVSRLDIQLAGELGYRIKLIASAARDGAGAIVQVAPALVPHDHPLARAGGALNALFIEGRRTGRLFIQGAGAGAGPTAAAVAADIADAASGARRRPVFGRPASGLTLLSAGDAENRASKVYLRLVVRDRPGVIADVSVALAKAAVSIDSILQHPVGPTGLVPIVLTTQAASASAIADAVEHISALDAVTERPRVLRIARA